MGIKENTEYGGSIPMLNYVSHAFGKFNLEMVALTVISGWVSGDRDNFYLLMILILQPTKSKISAGKLVSKKNHFHILPKVQRKY